MGYHLVGLAVGTAGVPADPKSKFGPKEETRLMLDRSVVHLDGGALSRRGPPEFFLSGRGRLPLGLFPATATYALVWASYPISVRHMLGAACRSRAHQTSLIKCLHNTAATFN